MAAKNIDTKNKKKFQVSDKNVPEQVVTKPVVKEPEIVKPKEEVKEIKKPKEYEITTLVNVRKNPSLKAEIITTFTKGTIVKVLDEKNGWFKTEKGWTMKEFFKERA